MMNKIYAKMIPLPAMSDVLEQDGLRFKVPLDYPRYRVTDQGAIYKLVGRRRYKYWKLYKGRKNNKGAIQVLLSHLDEKNEVICKIFILAHRLIAAAWVANDDPFNKREIDHEDGNRGNNHPSNLKWSTHKKNMLNINAPGGRLGKWHRNRRKYAVNGKYPVINYQTKQIDWLPIDIKRPRKYRGSWAIYTGSTSHINTP